MTMKTERFEMRTSAEFARVIDQWRRKQDSIPSRSDAVRSLVAQGLMFETLDEVFKNIMNFLVDATSSGKVSAEVADEIAVMMGPFLDDLELYTEARKVEIRDLRDALAFVKKFKQEDPEGFAKSPFALKPRQPKSKAPKPPTE